ncbi:hypothetical protein DPMN_077520 [Dreissena polymorpha]|uniref:Carbohydrate sulfotransferase n=1 Tax=Dreissena polymorpha TaxID=45954 RepID=A0A9D4BRF1_DREPO|nr:hypothetical protein DPMN_077520 [Dreissena polymorpha]
MFVRDPYKRIASAFVDKLLAPNPLFWKLFGRSAIERFRGVDKNRKCFHDVTFSEFVQFVVWAEKSKRELDAHFQVATEVCVPCTMKYDFIGKMERFQEDAYDVIDRLHQNATRHALNGNMASLAGDDAVMDSVHSPYRWKIQITRCISWHESLQRVWRKLQLRGLVEFGHPFPLDETSSRRITAAEFIALANTARRDSNPEKLRAQKEHVLAEMYRSVPLEVLEEMRTVFQADFEMFEYDSSPVEIFERSSAFSVKNVLDFRTQHITNP